MSRDDLKKHCIKTIEIREIMCKSHNITFESDNVYQEHKMILDMIEKLEKIESLYGIDKFGKVLTREERDREVQKILEES